MYIKNSFTYMHGIMNVEGVDHGTESSFKVCMHVYIYIYIYIYNTCDCLRIFFVHACVHADLCVCAFVCVCVCVFVFVCVHICM